MKQKRLFTSSKKKNRISGKTTSLTKNLRFVCLVNLVNRYANLKNNKYIFFLNASFVVCFV